MVISAISGSAGVGKTALAVYWAHQHAGLFPDGQLYVNLRGFSPSGGPVPVPSVIRGFLDALGIPAQRIPAVPDDQAALYRSVLAGRRMLVLLDNARDAAQVRPLLPGSPGCLVLVTSRSDLGGLVALDGAVPLTLGQFTHAEARGLLRRRLGAERVAADEEAAEEVITLCARLPLVLNIAAARAVLNPGLGLPEFAGQLRDSRRRLDTLTTGDSSADVRAVFSWSYRVLDPEEARVFRLLSVHPGPDISLAAAASLTALDADRARLLLDALTRAHLLTEHAPDRYSFHDLLRAFAAERASIRDSDAERDDALARVCDFYTHTAYGGERILYPDRQHPPFWPPASGTKPYPMPDDATAMAWFKAEHVNLLAIQQAAAVRAWDLTVWWLAWALFSFHARRARLHDDLAVWQTAAKAAIRLPDPAFRIVAHRLLGSAYGDLGDHQEATSHLRQALVLAGHHHDRKQQADTHYMLARSWQQQEDYRQALRHATQALHLFRDLGHSAGEADALNQVGWDAAQLGEYDKARASCQAALTMYQRHPHAIAEAATLDSLGFIEHHTGHHHQAIDYYQQALTRYRELAHAYQSANTLEHLGYPHAALGEHHLARMAWQQALDLYREQGRAADAERIERELGLHVTPAEGLSTARRGATSGGTEADDLAVKDTSPFVLFIGSRARIGTEV